MRIAAIRGELARLGFDQAVFGRRRLYLAPAIAARAQAIEQHLTSNAANAAPAVGNRRSAVAMTISGLPPMFVRRYRRGGLMRFVTEELHAGLVPRPLHELMVTAAARQRGMPVVEPVGAMVESIGPCLYRGWFLTRALEGLTMWNLLLAGDRRELRREAVRKSRDTVERLHQGGLYHADLNFHNLFACIGKEPLAVIALDLDKARLYPAALPPALRHRNFRRLARSARRLFEAGGELPPAERAILGIGPEN